MNTKFLKVKSNLIVMAICFFIIASIFYNGEELPFQVRIPYIGNIALLASFMIFIFYFWLKRKDFSIPKMLQFLTIISLFSLSRIIFIMNAGGLFDSDDAVLGIMSRHYSANIPGSLFFYGQKYLGSAYALINSLFFKILGTRYSTMGLCAIVFVALFIFVQFKIFREFFSLKIAFFSVIFYVFAGGIFSRTIFMVGGNFPFVYLLLSILLYLTLSIFLRERYDFIPVLGIVAGLAYWTHQITLIYSLASFIVVLKKKGFRGTLKGILFFFIGIVPLLLFEISEGFVNFRFTIASSIQTKQINSVTIGEKIANFVRGIKGLFPNRIPDFFIYLFFIIMVFGLLILLYLCFKKKFSSPEIVFLILFFLFCVFYFFSDFSNTYIERYFMPLYPIAPLLLFLPFFSFRWKYSYILVYPLISILFFFGFLEGKVQLKSVLITKNFRRDLYKNILKTGEKDWYFYSYNHSYNLVFMSQENLKISNKSLERYFPYKLSVYDSKNRNIFLLPFRGKKLEKKLKFYGIEYNLIKAPSFWLFYKIRDGINLWDIEKQHLSTFPEIQLAKIESRQVYFRILPMGNSPDELKRMRIITRIESGNLGMELLTPLSSIGETYQLGIPSVFAKDSIRIKTLIDDNGFPVIFSLKTWNIKLQGIEAPEKISFMRGFIGRTGRLNGFTHGRGRRWKERIHLSGDQLRVMGKKGEFRLKANRRKVNEIVIDIINPIDFGYYIWWRSSYCQRLFVKVLKCEYLYDLKYGENKIRIPLNDFPEQETVVFNLSTEYCIPFQYDEIGYFETGIVLRSVISK